MVETGGSRKLLTNPVFETNSQMMRRRGISRMMGQGIEEKMKIALRRVLVLLQHVMVLQAILSQQHQLGAVLGN